MTRLIDSSFGTDVAVTIGAGWSMSTNIDIHQGFKRLGRYTANDIKSITEIDEERFRSGGKAAVGAIIGGVLTGGIGLLAGAAIGGRRRMITTYLVVFNDDHHIAIEEKNKTNNAFFQRIIEKNQISDAVAKVKPADT